MPPNSRCPRRAGQEWTGGRDAAEVLTVSREGLDRLGVALVTCRQNLDQAGVGGATPSVSLLGVEPVLEHANGAVANGPLQPSSQPGPAGGETAGAAYLPSPAADGPA